MRNNETRRMPKKRLIQDEINLFLETWDQKQLTDFIRDITPLFDLYDINDESDWVSEAVGEDEQQVVRLIRTVYLVSRLCDFHASKMCSINCHFKDLWKRMEKEKTVERE